MIESYLWDGESVEKEFQFENISLYFTNKRLLLYSSDDVSKNFTEIPYESISSVDFNENEKLNEEPLYTGLFLVFLGLSINWILIEGSNLFKQSTYHEIRLWLRWLVAIIGTYFILIGVFERRKEFHLAFYFKDRDPFLLTGEDTVLEEIFKTSRDYRGKIELNR